MLGLFFLLPVLQHFRSSLSFQLPCATYRYMNWAVLLWGGVCVTWGWYMSLTSACSASVLFCPPQHPLGLWYCLCLHVLPSCLGPSFECLEVTRILGFAQPVLWAADISAVIFSSRRMMKMRILPLECLTVMFSSKMATSEQRHGLSCQFVSTQFMLSLVWGLFSADSIPVDSSVHFTLTCTCSHCKVLSTCKIRLIENSVCLLQPDRDLFPLHQ